jgi:hypothetical protein
MQDLVATLQWVHDNVANFGGDPDCVTIDAYLFEWQSQLTTAAWAHVTAWSFLSCSTTLPWLAR